MSNIWNLDKLKKKLIVPSFIKKFIYRLKRAFEMGWWTFKNHGQPWYDWAFIIDAIDKQLEHMEKNWHKSIHMEHEKELEEIKEARKKIEAIRNSVSFEEEVGAVESFFNYLRDNIMKWWD